MLEPYDVDGARLPRVRSPAGDVTLLRDAGRGDSWLLAVADVPQSYVDLADPTRLEFAYVRLLGDVADLAAPDGEPLRAAHLGGGAATLARYVAATRPGSEQVVVEADAGLARLVTERLGTPGFALVVGDARAELGRLPRGAARCADGQPERPAWRADLVVLDAFAGSEVPAHLTTLEHLDAVRGVLAPSGVYAVNVADSGALGYARSVAATLAARFADVAVLAAPAVLRGRRFGNLVLVAADVPLPVDALTRRAAARAAEPARVVAGGALDAWLAGATPRVDATAGPSPTPPAGVFTLSGPVVTPDR